ncbi:MAG: hypothetical protein K2N00_04950 [Lachnospiraceae bacterium]|nr:hypothetical protein [Lachnospiraceae bacterium]
MSSIKFSDYVDYANYNTGYDFYSLIGEKTNSSANLRMLKKILHFGKIRKLTKTTAGITDSTQKLLSSAGITIGKGNKLEVDVDALKEASITTLKSLFTGHGSFADKISQKAGSLSNAAANAAAGAKGATYTSNGGYSDTLSKLYSSTVDEKIGNKDKSSDTSSKTANKATKKEEQDTHVIE